MKSLYLAYFTLLDYSRSGNILVELILTAGFVAIFQRVGMTPAQLLSFGSVYLLALAVLTTLRILGRANRATAYPLIAKPLGRMGYLLGNLLASWLTIMAMYLLLLLSGIFISSPTFLADNLPGVALPLILTAWAVSVATLTSSLIPGAKWFRYAFILLIPMAFASETLAFWAQRLGVNIPTIVLAIPFWTLAAPIIAFFKFLAGDLAKAGALTMPLAIMTSTAIIFLLASFVLFWKRDLDLK